MQRLVFWLEVNHGGRPWNMTLQKILECITQPVGLEYAHLAWNHQMKLDKGSLSGLSGFHVVNLEGCAQIGFEGFPNMLEVCGR